MDSGWEPGFQELQEPHAKRPRYEPAQQQQQDAASPSPWSKHELAPRRNEVASSPWSFSLLDGCTAQPAAGPGPQQLPASDGRSQHQRAWADHATAAVAAVDPAPGLGQQQEQQDYGTLWAGMKLDDLSPAGPPHAGSQGVGLNGSMAWSPNPDPHAHAHPPETPGVLQPEIGRASCRERVCLYV